MEIQAEQSNDDIVIDLLKMLWKFQHGKHLTSFVVVFLIIYVACFMQEGLVLQLKPYCHLGFCTLEFASFRDLSETPGSGTES